MSLHSLFPLIVGLSVWIYGTLLLIKKLQPEKIDKKIQKGS